MTTTIKHLDDTPFAGPKNGPDVIGHLVVWNLPQTKTTFAAVAAALTEAGLDEAEARAKLPQNVLRKVLRKLDTNKLVDRVASDESSVSYQVSRKLRVDDGLEYERDVVVSLSKSDATVSCPDDPERGQEIQRLVNESCGERSGGDIITIGDRIFRKANVDKERWREAGGVYYFPARSFEIVDKVERFYALLGVRMSRMPIPKGDPRAESEVNQLVVAGNERRISELRASIQELTIDNRPDTFERRAEQIRHRRLMIECSVELMAAERQRLLDALDEADQDLIAVVDRITGAPDLESGSDDQGQAQDGQDAAQDGPGATDGANVGDPALETADAS